MDSSKQYFSNILKGAAMGIAEVIPGVSGGTIAFITGIYEKLINTIKALGPELVSAFRKDGLSGAWRSLDGPFLATLLLGMLAGVVIGVFGVSHLLEHYPPMIWAFFFGLIIASAIYIAQQIGEWRTGEWLALIAGTLVAYGITTITPAGGSEALPYVFLSGFIAISALILPGISGSFMLLLLGMYTFIISDTLKPALSSFASDKLLILAVFALGCLSSLATLSRLLSWLFRQYRSLTLATLTGFILGSLWKIWPWRNPVRWLEDSAGNIILDKDGITPKKVLVEANVWPGKYEGEPYVWAAVLLFVLGFVSVFLLERLGGEKH